MKKFLHLLVFSFFIVFSSLAQETGTNQPGSKDTTSASGRDSLSVQPSEPDSFYVPVSGIDTSFTQPSTGEDQDTSSSRMVQPAGSDTLNNVVSGTDTSSTPSANIADQDTSILPEPVAVTLEDTVLLTFVKQKTIHSSDSTLFNILKIVNTTEETVMGSIQFTVPEGWDYLFTSSPQVKVGPGDSAFLPLRVMIPENTQGGQAYIVNAALKTPDDYFSANSYIQVPLESKWNISVDNIIYFNEYFNQVDFDIYLENRGNSIEYIKLEFEIGRLLNLNGIDNNNNITYVELPPYSDTVITYAAANALLSDDERDHLKTIWKESVIKIMASTHLQQERQTIWFKNLDSRYEHLQFGKRTPLNVDVNFFNLVASNVVPRINTAVFGTVLLKEDRDINYVFNARNIYFQGPLNQSFFENPNNITLNAQYRSKPFDIRAGNVATNSLHSLAGIGGVGEYRFKKNHEVSAAFIRNRFLPIDGGNIFYTTKVSNVRIGTGVTYEDNNFFNYDAVSGHVRTSFSFLKNHSVNSEVVVSNVAYDLSKFNEDNKTFLGVGYRFNYTGSIENLRVRVTSYNNTLNYLRSSNSNLWQATANYYLKNRDRLNFLYIRNALIQTPYPDRLFMQESFFNQDLTRLTYGRRFSDKLYGEAGPMLRVMHRKQHFVNGNRRSYDFANQYQGVYGLARYKLAEFKSITPSLSMGYTTFPNDTNIEGSAPSVFTARTGVNYRNRFYSFLASYMYGPATFVDPFYFGRDAVYSQMLQARGSIEKYYWNRKMKLAGYASYLIRMPSNRQNFNATARTDFYLSKGWQINATGNIFTNSRQDAEVGVISNRNYSFFLGIRKAFDIPQPRIKYHDLKIVCFNDLNGNKQREENEPFLANIMVSFEQKLDSTRNIRQGIAGQELVTNPAGEVNYISIPEGAYNLSFLPLTNLKNLFNVLGDDQDVIINSDMILYIPYAESYRVKGKIILLRDEFTSEGKINVNGVRVSATAPTGEVYSALTDNSGEYVINVPQAGLYKIKVNNIFGSRFKIDKEEYEIHFDGFKSFQLDFKFSEQKRDVNINGDGGYEFKFLNGDQEDGNINQTGGNNGNNQSGSTRIEDRLNFNDNEINAPYDPNNVKFRVKIGMDEATAANKSSGLISDGFERTMAGASYTVLTSRAFQSYDAARVHMQDLLNRGYENLMVTGEYDGQTITSEKAREILGE